MKKLVHKDISAYMQCIGKRLEKCDHFCDNKPKNTIFYRWISFLDKEFIKDMCQTCALREAWGYNYKQNKHYKKWIDNE